MLYLEKMANSSSKKTKCHQSGQYQSSKVCISDNHVALQFPFIEL